MSNSGCTAETTEPYALRVIGDSMAPEFEHDHIIIVDPSITPYQNAFVVLEHNDQVLFGQFKRAGAAHRLNYLNGDYASISLGENYRVKGVITQRSTGRRKSIKHYDPPFKTL